MSVDNIRGWTGTPKEWCHTNIACDGRRGFVRLFVNDEKAETSGA